MTTESDTIIELRQSSRILFGVPKEAIEASKRWADYLWTRVMRVGYASVRASVHAAAQTSLDGIHVPLASWADTLGPTCLVDQTLGAMPTLSPRISGDYRVGFGFSFSGTFNQTFLIHVHVDTSDTDIKTDRKLSAGGDVGVVAISDILSVEAGQVLSLYVAAEGGSNEAITIHAGSFWMSRVR